MWRKIFHRVSWNIKVYFFELADYTVGFKGAQIYSTLPLWLERSFQQLETMTAKSQGSNLNLNNTSKNVRQCMNQKNSGFIKRTKGSKSFTNIDDRYKIAPAPNHNTNKETSNTLGKFWPLITNLMEKYM